ncbi:murein transglycosylase [Buchnera aphidicola (Muscaphis stroyani)]|uniref:peptidoglycan lytic exotransglycosylase n=1 Tax=Buchnera aphidicola (Muscaphis stroyani) TaxID=1241869 RepID=A0A4D6YCS7_9GAMM|nr:transglycosylase SLT domain-containing protein [Buchnera aphidicola]QCI24341.1 murein transglycosylase [Buchnera aphidicola (Muscaphis stroyani)]
MVFGILFFSIILLTGHSSFLKKTENFKKISFLNTASIENTLHKWNKLIQIASYKYNVDLKLIKSIIYTESFGIPCARSKSNAIGLMQIKPSTAGAEVYRLKKRKGQPSIQELCNPNKNIDIGVFYISILQNKYLIGIKDKEIMRYATILAYVNGASALLKIFDRNTKMAIQMINNMTKKVFLKYVKKNIQLHKQCII